MLLLPLAALGATGGRISSASAAPAKARADKVVIVGIPGVTWEDIVRADMPAFKKLMNNGAVTNVSVRTTNHASDGYLTLGAGQRANTQITDGLAFNRQEVIEHGSAADAFRRYTGSAAKGAVQVLPIQRIRQQNETQGFAARPGLLGDALHRSGRVTAVVGNADTALGPLPALLPGTSRVAPAGIEDPRIHREAALAAMRRDGSVPVGDVGRDLLAPNPIAPFGISTSVNALLAAFRQAASLADFIVVETGDTARADLYSLGFPEERQASIRQTGLALADKQIDALVQELKGTRTLLIIVAPTTPGGPSNRGQLRPALLTGPGISEGVLTSASTSRRGVITMPDLTATSASYLGLKPGAAGSGHKVEVISEAGPNRRSTPALIEELIEKKQRAETNDKVRAPLSFALIGLDLLIFAAGFFHLRKGRLPLWLRLLLVAALAFPVLSHLSGTPIWRLGPGVSALAIIVLTLLVAGVLLGIERTSPSSPSAEPGKSIVRAAVIIPAASVLFFLVDLALGAPAQLDSIFGYTSVSGGRYYGLGNLGFAMLAASAFLLAGFIADQDGKASRWLALGIVAVVTVWIGHPRLGADVGGTMAMVPAAIVLGMGLFGKRRPGLRHVPLLVLAALLMVAVFGAVDLLRMPEERTHLGNFLAGWFQDPGAAWLLLRRKVTTSATFGLMPWGIIVPAAAVVLVSLRRHAGVWKSLRERRPFFGPTLQALIAVAIFGSVFNDSGVVVGGMVLAMSVPWVFLLASEVIDTGR